MRGVLSGEEGHPVNKARLMQETRIRWRRRDGMPDRWGLTTGGQFFVGAFSKEKMLQFIANSASVDVIVGVFTDECKSGGCAAGPCRTPSPATQVGLGRE